MTPKELIDEHYFDIGTALVRANLLSEAGTNIWVVFTESAATVETLGSSEWPAEWKPEVIHAVYWGRAIGWESQCAEEWGYYWEENNGVFVTGTGAVCDDEVDAARWAVDEGHCPELINEAMDQLREALAEQEVA